MREKERESESMREREPKQDRQAVAQDCLLLCVPALCLVRILCLETGFIHSMRSSDVMPATATATAQQQQQQQKTRATAHGASTLSLYNPAVLHP